MANPPRRQRGPQDEPHRVKIIYSTKRRVQELEDLMYALRSLVVSVTVLALQVSASAAVITGVLMTTSPPAGPAKQCTDEILLLGELSIIAATDEMFWKNHPELQRRKIRSHEKEYSAEWWQYYKAIEACRKTTPPSP